MEKTGREKFILIDTNAMIHRAFHALPPLTSPKGIVTNAVFGFSSILIKLIREIKPTYMVAAMDLQGPTFRHQQYEQYKSHRVKAPKELYEQIPIVREVLKAFGIPIFEKQGFEADDLIGTVSEKTRHIKNMQTIIATGDLDALQLVEDEKVVVFTMRKGMSDTVIYDEKAVFDRYGLSPSQLADYRGLKGDPSDNIPGVSGIGEKTASSLIKDFGSIEKLYEKIDKSEINEKLKEKLLNGKDQALFSKELSIIVRDIDIDFSLDETKWRKKTNISEIERLFAEFGFKSLSKRLTEIDLGRQESHIDVDEPPNIKNYFDELGMSEIYEKIEKPLIPVLKEMENRGIKIDLHKLNALSEKVDLEVLDLEKQIYKQAGKSFNINSPSQLSKVLYDDLGLVAKIRKTAGGARSTAASELEKLRDEHQIVDLIMQYRELQKLKTTYIDTFPALVAKDGRIHTTFDQIGTSTGRISSQNPNLQNIPVRTELGQEFRKIFVAEKGYELVSFDYSQMELRIVAHVSKDKKMIEAFKMGEDIHTRTASEVFEVAPYNVPKEMRRQAKALNFGIIYGMGVLGFSRATGLDREKSKQFINSYLKEFSGVAEYMEKIKKQAKRDGYVSTIFGRKRKIPEIYSEMPQVRATGERMAINMPTQGTLADIVKIAMVKVDNYIKQNTPADKVRMLLQIHDELLFEIETDLVVKVAPKIKNIMEETAKLDVPVIVDVKAGKNWQEMDKLNL